MVRRLAWNMPCHAYPALPFHALPAAHTVLAEHIDVQASGAGAAPRNILRKIPSRVA